MTLWTKLMCLYLWYVMCTSPSSSCFSSAEFPGWDVYNLWHVMFSLYVQCGRDNVQLQRSHDPTDQASAPVRSGRPTFQAHPTTRSCTAVRPTSQTQATTAAESNTHNGSSIHAGMHHIFLLWVSLSICPNPVTYSCRKSFVGTQQIHAGMHVSYLVVSLSICLRSSSNWKISLATELYPCKASSTELQELWVSD